MMKKIGSIFLLFMLCLTMLISCGTAPRGGEETTASLSVSESGSEEPVVTGRPKSTGTATEENNPQSSETPLKTTEAPGHTTETPAQTSKNGPIELPIID